MPRSGTASGSAPTTPASQGGSTAPAERGRQTRKRVERPEIDLDANIRDARATIERARAALTQARQQAKADRRRKARLIKKACHLTPADLKRIAVLKRCGFSGVDRDTSTLQIPTAANADATPVAHNSAANGASGAASSTAASSTPAQRAASCSAGPAGNTAEHSPASIAQAADLQARVDDNPLT